MPSADKHVGLGDRPGWHRDNSTEMRIVKQGTRNMEWYSMIKKYIVEVTGESTISVVGREALVRATIAEVVGPEMRKDQTGEVVDAMTGIQIGGTGVGSMCEVVIETATGLGRNTGTEIEVVDPITTGVGSMRRHFQNEVAFFLFSFFFFSLRQSAFSRLIVRVPVEFLIQLKSTYTDMFTSVSSPFFSSTGRLQFGLCFCASLQAQHITTRLHSKYQVTCAIA